MIRKRLLVPIIVLTITTSSLFVLPASYAQSSTNTIHPTFLQGIIQFLAQKFNLDKSQVESAILEYKAQHKNTPKPTLSVDDLQKKEKEKLDKFVNDGKITASQEQAILSELKILHEKYNPENLKNLSAEEKRKKMQEMRDELKKWANDNGVNINLLMPMGGMMKGRGMRMHDWKNATTTPTPSQ